MRIHRRVFCFILLRNAGCTTLRMHNHRATSAAFLSDGKQFVITGLNHPPATVWNLETREYCVSLIRSRFERLYGAMFLSDARLATVGSETISDVCVWDLPQR